MSRFTIGIIGNGKRVHSACFEDFAKALADALRALGHELVDFGPEQGRLILFGANNVTDPANILPPDAIIFNSEQLAAFADPTQQMVAHEQYRTHVVWDYSRANIAKLRAMGIERAVHCPVGYVPSMTKIAPAVEDIDVLFYGSVNPRRAEILDAIEASGLRVERLFGIYGAERDAFVARSKIVLNLHFYDRPVFEIFRVSHLLANKKCVVTEDGGCDDELEEFAKLATWVVPREPWKTYHQRMAEACIHLASYDKKRAAVAESGFDAFRRLDLTKIVERALQESA